MTSIDPVFPAALTLFGLVGLLVADYRESQRGRWLSKPLAAAGFVLVAVAVGAFETVYGSWILAGLVLSFFGDVLLIPSDRPAAFKAGLVSFLLGHVAYVIAFLQLEIDSTVVGGLGVVSIAIAAIVLRWLRPHLPPDMQIPVLAYVVVISSMLVLAAGVAVAEERGDILAGAFLFYLSDLSVARERFVSKAFANGAWGLPAYFIGQLILAWGSGG